MEVRIQVKVGARNTGCTELAPGVLLVSVRQKPIAGAANEAVIGALAAYFRVPSNAVTIIRGHQKKYKVARISSVVH